MFVRVVKSGPRNYLRIVENYRDKATGKVRQRTVANLCRIEGDDDEKVKVLESWLGIKGNSNLKVEFLRSKDFGDVFLLHGIWQDLGLDGAFRSVLEQEGEEESVSERTIALVRMMVFHRICDPGSKLSCLRWLESAVVPKISGDVSYQSMLRAMDFLAGRIGVIEKELAKLIMPLLDRDLTLALYDLTTVLVHGESELEDDLRQRGLSKDTKGIERQFVLGLVQDGNGFPLKHQVHKGNQGEAETLEGVVEALLEDYPVRRIVAVADRGLLSGENVEKLVRMQAEKGRDLQFILGVPARRYRELTESLSSIELDGNGHYDGEFMGHRLVVYYNEEIANEQSEKRLRDIRKLREQQMELVKRLRDREREPARGRPLTRQSVVNKLRDAIRAKSLSRIVKVDDEGKQVKLVVNTEARQKAEGCDGKMAILTNVADMEVGEVVTLYRNRSDIERGFRTMKEELEIAPVYHRLPDRIRAHAAICFLALLLNRCLRYRLRKCGRIQSPREALRVFKSIQLMKAKVNGKEVVAISNRTAEQLSLFEDLELEDCSLSHYG